MLGIKEDSRTILERLRRKDLQRILMANNIAFDESKTPANLLRSMIEQGGFDPMDPKNGIEYQSVKVENEDGSFHEEIFPIEKPHASLNKEIDYDKYITKAEDVDEQSQVNALQDRIRELEAKLDGKQDVSSMKMPELRKLAKEKGLKVSPSTKKPELVEMLNENTP